MKTEIYENIEAFWAREDKTINGVSPAFAAANPKYAEERGNEGCWNCSGCSRCSDCSHLASLLQSYVRYEDGEPCGKLQLP